MSGVVRIGLLVILVTASSAWADEKAATDEEIAVAEFNTLTELFKGGDCDAMAKALEAYDPSRIQAVMKRLEAKYKDQLKAKREAMPGELKPLFDAVVETSKTGMQAVAACKDHEGFQTASKKLDAALQQP